MAILNFFRFSLGLFLFLGLAFTNQAQAAAEAPQSFTLDGQLTQAGNDLPLLDANLKITVQILDPSKTCLLYQETHDPVDTTASNGYYNIRVGSNTGSPKRTGTDPGLSMVQIFQNGTPVTAANAPSQSCSGGTMTYTPVAGDARYFRLIITPSATNIADTLAPDAVMDSVPNAIVAERAESLQGYVPGHFLRTNTTAPNVVDQTNIESIFNTTNFPRLTTLLSVAPTNYVQTNSNGSVGLPLVTGTGNPSSGLTPGQIWYDDVADVLKYYDGGIKTVGTSTGLTSVGLSLPGMFTVTGSPLTANGSISATLANQAQNSVFAGPATGGAGAPTFRALASSDLPITGATGAVLNGGNSFGAAASIGTNDNNTLSLRTNNSDKMTILANGNVGIGTATPAGKLQVITTGINPIELLHYETTEKNTYNIGTNMAGGTNQAGQFVIRSQTNANRQAFVISDGISTDNTLGFSTSTDSGVTWNPRFVINQSGNVGIGTNAPSSELSIASSDGYTGIIINNTATGNAGLQATGYNRAEIMLRATSAPADQEIRTIWSDNGVLNFGKANDAWSVETTHLSILNDGKVGIGTTSPGRLLHVNGPMRLTASALPGTPATGDIAVDSGDGNKLKWYDGSGWQAAGGSGGGGGMAGSADITGATYTITSGQGGYYFTYNGSSAGTINLPALSGLSDGFQVTIMRQVAQAVTITPDGSDSFPSGLTTLEMRGQNMQSVTLTKMGSKWNITNKTDDCVVGQSCWGTNSLYFGTFNGHQYFTTPGGCTNSGTPTCAGGTDSVTKAWANNSGTTAYNVNAIATDDFRDGVAQSATLASSYTDTDAAKFCEGMTYAGYSDWYLPSRQELNLLYQKSGEIGGFQYSSLYWSSTEFNITLAWYFTFSSGLASNNTKTTAYYVRCVRRF